MRLSATALVAAAVMAVCVVAGFWQFGRHEVRSDAKTRYEANASAAPAAWDDVEPVPSSEFLRVELTGEFVADSRTSMRDRRVDRVRSDQDLAWFRTSGGNAVLVLVGWAPAGEPPAPLPAATGTITAMVRTMEQDDGRGADSATRITPAQLPAVDGAVPAVYVAALADCAAADCLDLPGEPVPQPQPTLGPHLAYSVQWWLFAALAPVGAIALVRRDRADAPAKPRKPRRRARGGGPTDEEIEDAL